MTFSHTIFGKKCRYTAKCCLEHSYIN